MTCIFYGDFFWFRDHCLNIFYVLNLKQLYRQTVVCTRVNATVTKNKVTLTIINVKVASNISSWCHANKTMATVTCIKHASMTRCWGKLIASIYIFDHRPFYFVSFLFFTTKILFLFCLIINPNYPNILQLIFFSCYNKKNQTFLQIGDVFFLISCYILSFFVR